MDRRASSSSTRSSSRSRETLHVQNQIQPIKTPSPQKALPLRGGRQTFSHCPASWPSTRPGLRPPRLLDPSPPRVPEPLPRTPLCTLTPLSPIPSKALVSLPPGTLAYRLTPFTRLDPIYTASPTPPLSAPPLSPSLPTVSLRSSVGAPLRRSHVPGQGTF